MLGLPVLGWGVDNIAGFISDPARAGIAATAFLLSAYTGFAVYRAQPFAKDIPHDPEHWHYSLLELAFILSAYGSRRGALVWGDLPVLGWTGVAIYLLGFIYTVWANETWINHLRREAGYAYDTPTLLSEGPFAWTRFPVMTSLLCYHLGFTLAFHSWVGLAFTLPIVYTVIRRVNIWEREFSVQYPKEWRLREMTSKRFIPFLY
jgi:protein-S-isoprenylcysteine O-methyltransferase Ste14